MAFLAACVLYAACSLGDERENFVFFIVAERVPSLPLAATSQTADAVALFVQRADADAGAVDDKQFKLRHDKGQMKATITTFCTFGNTLSVPFTKTRKTHADHHLSAWLGR